MRKALLSIVLLGAILATNSCKAPTLMSDDAYAAVFLADRINYWAWCKSGEHAELLYDLEDELDDLEYESHYELSETQKRRMKKKLQREIDKRTKRAIASISKETCEDYGYTYEQYRRKQRKVVKENKELLKWLFEVGHLLYADEYTYTLHVPEKVSKAPMSDDTYFAIVLTDLIKIRAWMNEHSTWEFTLQVAESFIDETTKEYGYTHEQFNEKASAVCGGDRNRIPKPLKHAENLLF